MYEIHSLHLSSENLYALLQQHLPLLHSPPYNIRGASLDEYCVCLNEKNGNGVILNDDDDNIIAVV